MIGCSAEEVGGPEPLTNPVTSKKKTAKNTSKEVPPPVAKVDPLPSPVTEPEAPTATDTVWVGSMDISKSVDFGGDPYCKYSVVFTNVSVKLTLDANNRVKSSIVTGNMVESTTTDCPHPPIGKKAHGYSFVPDAASGLSINYLPSANNAPETELATRGAMDGAGKIRMNLKWHRTDQTAPFDWTVENEVELTPQR